MATRHHALFTKSQPARHTAKESDYIYGKTEEGIDTGVHIEGEGVLFIGKTALREMGEVMGWSFIEDGQGLEEEIAHLVHENEQLIAQNLELRADLDAVGRAIANARDTK